MSLSLLCPLVPLNPFASSSTSLLSPLAFQKKKDLLIATWQLAATLPVCQKL